MAPSVVDATAAAAGLMIRHWASSILRVSLGAPNRSIQATIVRSPRFQKYLQIIQEERKDHHF
jgi:hypothetical protein